MRSGSRRTTPRPIINRGLLLQQQGRLDEAIGAYRQAIAHKADYAEAINNIGIVRQQQGELDESAS